MQRAPTVRQELAIEPGSALRCTVAATCADIHGRLEYLPKAAASPLDWSYSTIRNFASSVSSSLDLQAADCKTFARSCESSLRRCGVAHFSAKRC